MSIKNIHTWISFNYEAIVQSLKILYDPGRLTLEQLEERVEKGTITLEELNEIVET